MPPTVTDAKLVQASLQEFRRRAKEASGRASQSEVAGVGAWRKAESLVRRGLDGFTQGRYEEALGLLVDAEKALSQLGAGEFATWCLLWQGGSLAVMERWNEAVAVLKRAVASEKAFDDNEHAMLFNYLGIAEHNAGLHTDAVGTLERAIELSKHSTSSSMRKNVLALSLMRGVSLGLLEKFQEAFDVCQELDPPSDEEPSEVKADYYKTLAGALSWAGSDAAMAGHGGRMEQTARQLITLRKRAELQGHAREVDARIRLLEGQAATKQAELSGLSKDMAGQASMQEQRKRLRELEDQWAAAEEFALLVRLLSINDPSERWEAIGENVRKRWPKGLSAVDAVREMRD